MLIDLTRVRLSSTALYPHLWVLPKCFDTQTICGLCWPAPAASVSPLEGSSNFPEPFPPAWPPAFCLSIAASFAAGPCPFHEQPGPGSTLVATATIWPGHGVDHQGEGGATLGATVAPGPAPAPPPPVHHRPAPPQQRGTLPHSPQTGRRSRWVAPPMVYMLRPDTTSKFSPIPFCIPVKFRWKTPPGLPDPQKFISINPAWEGAAAALRSPGRRARPMRPDLWTGIALGGPGDGFLWTDWDFAPYPRQFE